MARDEAMMFPNERIKSWLTNNRTVAQETPEDSIAGVDAPAREELSGELDAVETREQEALG